MRRYLLLSVVAVLGCEKKATEPRFEGPMPVTFGDCAAPAVTWVSGPRPAPFTPAEAADVWVDDGAIAAAPDAKRPQDDPPPPEPDDPPPPEDDESGGTGTAMALDEGKMGKKDSDRAEGQYKMRRNDDDEKAARQQAIEAARSAGIIGSTALVEGGAFASLTGTGDVSSGFDDTNIYGGLLGNEAGEMNGGYGYGRSGFGPGGGGTGWGTIGTGRYGTIGHGSGTGAGYGVGGGRGGMRGRSASVPTVSIGQPNAQGDLDKAIIRRYVKRNIQKIQYCYEKQLLAKPGLAGTVSTQFFIAPSGRVASSSGTGVDPAVANCVADVIKGIEFPKPKGGGGVQVNYPFTFRPAGGGPDVTAATGSAAEPAGSGSATTTDAAGSGSAVGGGSAAGSAAEPKLSPTATRRLFRKSGDAIDKKYQPGALNPLRAEEQALTECFRKGAKHWGAAVVELAYDGAGKVTTATLHGVDDKRVVACVTSAAKRVKRATAGVQAERCSVAFGEMPPSALPALDVTTGVHHAGKVQLDDKTDDPKIEAVVDLVKARVKAVTAKSAPVVSLHGPLVVRAVDTAQMTLVNRVVRSVLAGGDDFVLATQKGTEWELFTPLALPVVPVPFGTGAVWNPVKSGSRSGNVEDDERVHLSVLLTEGSIWVGLSRVNEFVEIPRSADTMKKLVAALKQHKDSEFFKERSDIEIAAEGAATYADFIAAVRASIDTGFVDWRFSDPVGLSARPHL